MMQLLLKWRWSGYRCQDTKRKTTLIIEQLNTAKTQIPKLKPRQIKTASPAETLLPQTLNPAQLRPPKIRGTLLGGPYNKDSTM